jgi:outer membrane protein assembly factor BamB
MASDPWGSFQGDAANTGSAASGPLAPYEVSWSLDVPTGGPDAQYGSSAPVVSGSTVVTVGTDEVLAIDAETGTESWAIDREPGPSSPAGIASSDGTTSVIFAQGWGPNPPVSASATPTDTPTASASPSADGDEERSTSSVVAVELATGDSVWGPVEVDGASRGGVTVEGALAYVATQRGVVYAIDTDTGDVAWTAKLAGPVEPALAVAGDVVIASTRARGEASAALVALDASDGSQVWTFTGASIASQISGVAADDERVYTGIADRSSVAVRAFRLDDGSAVWSSRVTVPINLVSPPVVSGESVYAVDFQGQAYGFDAVTGERRWDFAINERVLRSAPVAIRAGSVEQLVVPTTEGRLSAIDVATGELVWESDSLGHQLRTLAVTPDVLVAVVGGDAPGLVGLVHDPDGILVRQPSPTMFDPLALLIGLGVGLIPVALLALLGRWLLGRSAPAFDDEFADGYEDDDEEEVEEHERDDEDDS